MTVDSLPVGFRLDEPIYDEQGVLLLDAGIELTESFIESLRTRGIVRVILGSEGAARRSAGERSRAREVSKEVTVARLLDQVGRRLRDLSATSGQELPVRVEDFDPIALQQVTSNMGLSLEALDHAVTDLAAGHLVSVDGVRLAAAQNTLDVVEDPDLALQAACTIPASEELSDALFQKQALSCGILSLMIGVRIQLDAESLLHLGAAAMLADLGLVAMRDTSAKRSITEQGGKGIFADRWHQHPEVGFEKLIALKTVPGPVLQAVRQHHELLDGTGFPSGLADERITLNARIIGMSQAYLALTSPLNGAPGYLPADVMAYLMHHAIQGKFCRKVMQAFLKAVSIYPLGSLVQLEDERVATVIRSTGRDSTRPIIRVDNQIVDPRQAGSPRIVGPIPNPHVEHRRLLTSSMNTVLWQS